MSINIRVLLAVVLVFSFCVSVVQAQEQGTIILEQLNPNNIMLSSQSNILPEDAILSKSEFGMISEERVQLYWFPSLAGWSAMVSGDFFRINIHDFTLNVATNSRDLWEVFPGYWQRNGMEPIELREFQPNRFSITGCFHTRDELPTYVELTVCTLDVCHWQDIELNWVPVLCGGYSAVFTQSSVQSIQPDMPQTGTYLPMKDSPSWIVTHSGWTRMRMVFMPIVNHN